jgi:2-alkenal reductase
MKNLLIAFLLFAVVTTPILYNPPPPQPVIVATQVMPSIVSIECLQKAELTFVIPGQEPKVMTLWNVTGMGSGIIVGNGNYIATCAHVVDGADKFAVWVDGEAAPIDASVLYFSKEQDMAILKLNTVRRFKPVEFNLEEPKIGETVYAVGNPFGHGKSFTSGMVNRLNDRHMGLDSIVFDASANPGNSGGALFDSKGRLIGIVWGLYAPRPQGFPASWAGIGLAYSVKRLAAQLPDAIAKGAATVTDVGEPPRP